MKQNYFTLPGFTFRLRPCSLSTALFLLVFLLNFTLGFGQDRTTMVPQYEWDDSQPLPGVNVTSGLNTDVVTIAVATAPDNFVYTLTFGEGVTKRNPDGSEVEGGFITGLNNPLDIAIDEDGYFYIADYLAGGNTYDDNGQIKIYDPDGNYQRSILTSYFRPLGIDVDEQNVYIAEYNDGNQGPESTPSSSDSVIKKAEKPNPKEKDNAAVDKVEKNKQKLKVQSSHSKKSNLSPDK